ncbi:MAG: DUF302 domain-containing protein [Anaerolineales bacterium]|nr:DUF302 domain-containing protein [Anaerolineales bacterium]
MAEVNTNYGFRTKLDLTYEQAKEKVTAALKEEGFGVMTEIDVKGTLKEKLNVDHPKYVILGACNPQLAHQALNTEFEVGLLLPCNVIVYEDDGKSVVSIVDPVTLLGVVKNPDLQSVAEDARIRLSQVLRSLKA